MVRAFGENGRQGITSKSSILLEFLLWGVMAHCRVYVFCPKGHGFDSHPSRHVRTLGKSFTHSCLWHSGMKFRHSILAVSGAPLTSSGLRGCYRNSLNE